MSGNHAHRSHSHTREAAPNTDLIVANFEKESASGTLHALTLTIVGFDKCGGLIMKDKNNELFDPRVNLRNGILEITRPLVIPKAAPAECELEF